MKKYWAFCQNSLQNTFVYRGPIVIWLLSNCVNLLVAIVLWLSVSAGDKIGGYSKPELITYYIVGLFFQWLIGWLPFHGVLQEIKKGEIVFSLIKPFSYFWRKFFEDLGWHLFSLWVGLLGSGLIAFFFRQYLVFNLESLRLLLLLPSLVLATFVVFGLSLCLGLVAFWTTDIYALGGFFWMTRSLLGGQGIPLSFIPQSFQTIVRFLPFRYTFSFPLEIYFSKLDSAEIRFGFLMSLFWAIFFYRLYKLLWNRGRRVYTAFGQ